MCKASEKNKKVELLFSARGRFAFVWIKKTFLYKYSQLFGLDLKGWCVLKVSNFLLFSLKRPSLLGLLNNIKFLLPSKEFIGYHLTSPPIVFYWMSFQIHFFVGMLSERLGGFAPGLPLFWAVKRNKIQQKQDRFKTCFSICGTGSLFQGLGVAAKSLWCQGYAES